MWGGRVVSPVRGAGVRDETRMRWLLLCSVRKLGRAVCTLHVCCSARANRWICVVGSNLLCAEKKPIMFKRPLLLSKRHMERGV